LLHRRIRYLTFVDPSIGSSDYIARIAREFHLIAQRALKHLNHPNCETACDRCLKSYQNQRHQDKLRWPAIIADLEQFAETAPQTMPLESGDTQDPPPFLRQGCLDRRQGRRPGYGVRWRQIIQKATVSRTAPAR
jgi:hypothetical protein